MKIKKDIKQNNNKDNIKVLKIKNKKKLGNFVLGFLALCGIGISSLVLIFALFIIIFIQYLFIDLCL